MKPELILLIVSLAVFAAMIVLLKVFGSVNKVYGRIKARLTGRTNEN